MAEEKKRVLILGGGFGGIKAALELAGHPAFEITLISDRSDFRYYPMLYRTATGGSPVASSIPLSEIFEGKDVKIVSDTVQRLDRASKKIKGSSGKAHSYDVLIVALGVVTNFFGIKGLAENAYGIKTQEEAKRLHDHLHQRLLDDKKPDIHYVVVGGGATGVELAGALPDYIHRIMRRHGLPRREIQVELVEAAPRVLSRMPPSYSHALQRRLRRLGVKLHLGQTVQAETHDALMVSGRPIASHTVVWTAGVTNHPFLKTSEFKLSDHGKALVDHYLQAEPGIYVVGDNAETRYSGMAQTALRDGLYVADNLKRQAEAKKLIVYKAKKPIYVVPAGPHWSAVLWGKTQIYGWLGWILRTAADFVGYHDLEPWWKASKHWLADSEDDETCPICSPKNTRIRR